MFSLDHVKDSFKVVFKKRADRSRRLIVILVLVFVLHCLLMATTQIRTQYIKVYFTWADTTILNSWVARLNSVETALNAVATALFLPLLSQVFKLNDMVIALICVVSSFMGMSVLLMARAPWVLYIAITIQMFTSCTSTAIRAALSKIVQSQDTGKVCSDY